MKKHDYTAFDAQLVALITGGMSSFASLASRQEEAAKPFCEGTKVETFRVVDRRLQALRKAGRIGHDTKRGWLIRLVDGGYPSNN